MATMKLDERGGRRNEMRGVDAFENPLRVFVLPLNAGMIVPLCLAATLLQ